MFSLVRVLDLYVLLRTAQYSIIPHLLNPLKAPEFDLGRERDHPGRLAESCSVLAFAVLPKVSVLARSGRL